ncbi:YqgQ family protein [Alkalibacillus flavidus]|uniref:YqgQ family protein n=1 Tax=Alkalibacillus flavidus TaxID=546021 RepID=UPI003673341F
MNNLESFIDVQQLLKQFGIFVYIGHRESDILLMEEEVKELYQNGLVSLETYKQALLILRSEKSSS